MGGDQNMDCLEDALEIVREFSLKTCVYSGLDDPEPFAHIDYLLDYLKIGHYDQKLGGLDSPDTNQKLYMYTDHSIVDITYKMRRDENESAD
jgi:anaerobic ribonucleoside-triphosphate reductase activating protein